MIQEYLITIKEMILFPLNNMPLPIAILMYILLTAVVLIVFISRPLNRDMSRTCGHKGRPLKWIHEEQAWLCQECLNEYLIDRAKRHAR